MSTSTLAKAKSYPKHGQNIKHAIYIGSFALKPILMDVVKVICN